jgi:secreted trypsin-like serine protease
MQFIVAILTFFYFYNPALAEEKIYGGYQIDITQAPYMVHITYIREIFANGSGITANCGGSILRKNLILTAGHC